MAKICVVFVLITVGECNHPLDTSRVILEEILLHFLTFFFKKKTEKKGFRTLVAFI